MMCYKTIKNLQVTNLTAFTDNYITFQPTASQWSSPETRLHVAYF